MCSRNLLNEEFRDGFLIYNDIFAIHTKYVCVHGVTMRKWKQYIKSPAEMTRFEEKPSVHNSSQKIRAAISISNCPIL